MILLLVTIGLLNIGLGFGLAMYYGYGPPGLDGIFEALGPMPPSSPPAQLVGGLGTPYDPFVATPSEAGPSASLAEEEVLGEIRDLAGAAQNAMVGGPVESHE